MSFHKVNDEQRLYVLNAGNGYSCLGFDVAEQRSNQLLGFIVAIEPDYKIPKEAAKGTEQHYRRYETLSRKASEICRQRNIRCNVQLTPELIGLEGKRVEIEDNTGETRRFIVGKSTGWMPVHLEIKTKRSTGGCAAYGSPFKSIRTV